MMSKLDRMILVLKGFLRRCLTLTLTVVPSLHSHVRPNARAGRYPLGFQWRFFFIEGAQPGGSD